MAHIDPTTMQAMLKESLARGLHPRLTVTSNSMAPLIRVGDQVILKAVQPEQLKPGDIITVVSQQDLLTHRIWMIQSSAAGPVFVTRGDRPLYFDPPLSVSDIVGLVCGRTRRQHTLWWQSGPGAWLNQHLAALARREYRRLTGSEEVPSRGYEPVTLTFRVKLIHRLFYGWALLLTGVVNVAARILPGENKI